MRLNPFNPHDLTIPPSNAGHIPLDLREVPEDLYGIFTENAIVLVGGEVGDGGAFRVMQIGWPPPEPRCVFWAGLGYGMVGVRACMAVADPVRFTSTKKISAETLRHLRSLELLGKGFTPQQYEDLAIMEKQVGSVGCAFVGVEGGGWGVINGGGRLTE